MNSKRSKRHTEDNTTKCNIRGGHFGSRSCVQLKPQVPDFGGEKAYPLCLSGGSCFLCPLTSAVVGSLPTDLGSGCGWVSLAVGADCAARRSVADLGQQLLRVATDFGSGVSWWLGGVAGVTTLLTTQVGWWFLSPCTVSLLTRCSCKVRLAVELYTPVLPSVLLLVPLPRFIIPGRTALHCGLGCGARNGLYIYLGPFPSCCFRGRS